MRFTGTRADASMDMFGIDLLTVREGKITDVRLFSADGPAEDSFWGHCLRASVAIVVRPARSVRRDIQGDLLDGRRIEGPLDVLTRKTKR